MFSIDYLYIIVIESNFHEVDSVVFRRFCLNLHYGKGTIVIARAHKDRAA